MSILQAKPLYSNYKNETVQQLLDNKRCPLKFYITNNQMCFVIQHRDYKNKPYYVLYDNKGSVVSHRFNNWHLCMNFQTAQNHKKSGDCPLFTTTS